MDESSDQARTAEEEAEARAEAILAAARAESEQHKRGLRRRVFGASFAMQIFLGIALLVVIGALVGVVVVIFGMFEGVLG